MRRRSLSVACLRPSIHKDTQFPRAVATSGTQSISIAAPDSTRACFQLDRVCHGDSETGQVLGEIQEQLLQLVQDGHDAALCVVGSRGTGKSRCLFGSMHEFDGMLSKFSEAYYSPKEKSRFVELAISQIYGEQVCDLLLPSLKWRSKHEMITYHVATSKEEFMLLVKEALAVKAALSFQSDMFLQCAHLHIHCVCMHRSAISFVELGTSALPPGMVDSKSPDPTLFPAEQSLECLRRSKIALCGRVGAAYICASTLTTYLWDIFDNYVPTIWLACLSQRLIDVDETLETMELVAKARCWANRPLEVNNETSQKFPKLLRKGRQSNIPPESIKATKEYMAARRAWINGLGLQHNVLHRGDFLLNVSSDASLSKLLTIILDDSVGIAIGSESCQDTDSLSVLFGVAGIHSLHCIISVTLHDKAIVLRPQNNAFVCVNGHLVRSTCKVSNGDYISFGPSILFMVCSEKLVGNSSQYFQDCWQMAARYFSRDLIHEVSLNSSNAPVWRKQRLESHTVLLSGMVHEANQVSDELRSDVKYAVKVLDADSDDDDEPWLCVLVTSGSHDVDDTWSAARMSHRLAEMREHRSKIPPDLIRRSFFYEPPNHQLIGIGFCFLEPILHMMDISTNVPIVNFKGETTGIVKIKIIPTVQRNPNKHVYLSSELSLRDHVGGKLYLDIKIQAAQNLPKNLCSSVYVSTSFFLRRSQFSTARCDKDTVSPLFQASFSLTQIITDDLLAYVASDSLELQVLGQPSPRNSDIG